MIITCNCGEKKFTLPDNSIPAAGRMVQCGFCGLKWKQFPVNEINKTKPISIIKKISSDPKKVLPKRQKAKKVKKTSVRKSREINLYSPEYLAKKHGITLSNNDKVKEKNLKPKIKQGFGFYNYLILLIVSIIFLLKVLHFNKNIIYFYFPFLEIYIEYLFESIFNIFEILRNFFGI